MKHALWIVVAKVVLAAVGATWAAETPTVGTDLSRIMADAIVLSGGPGAAPEGLRVKTGDQIAFMGDSITSTNMNRGGYLRLVEYVLKQNYPELKLTFVNAGIGGHRADMMAPRFLKDCKIGAGTTLVFINAGVNDVGQRKDRALDQEYQDMYRSNLVKMAEEAQAAGVPAIMMTPTIIYESADSAENQRMQVYANLMKQVAQEKGCGLVDLHGMFMAAIANKPAGGLYLTNDAVHMAAYGDALIALGVLRALGVPDATLTATDVVPALKLVLWPTPMAMPQVLERLGVPLSKFSTPDWQRFVDF